MTIRRRTSRYRLRPLLIATTLAASSVVFAAAPSLSATTAPTKPVPKAAAAKAAAAKAANPLPVMNVTDVKTGKSVALASFVNGTRPVLVWFWAPH